MTDKLYKDALRRKEKQDKRTIEHMKSEFKKATFKPLINKMSRRLALRKCSTPIYERYQEMQQSKERSIGRLKQDISQRESYGEHQCKPSICLRQSTISKPKRPFNELLKYLNDWNKEKEEKIKLKRKEQQNKEFKECSYYPQISKTSVKIVNWKRFLRKESSCMKINKSRNDQVITQGFYFPITVDQLHKSPSSISSIY